MLPSSYDLVHRRGALGEDSPKDHVEAMVGESSTLMNPWRMLWTSDAIQQPTALVLTIGDPTDFSDTERIALVWRTGGDLILDQKHTVKEGSTLVVDIPEVRGYSLEIWGTDALPLGVAPIQRSSIAAERAKANAKNAANNATPNPFAALLDTVSKMQALALVAAVAVAIVAGPSIVKALR